MTIKKKDNKNRILRERESQTKDGRYRYTYYENGKHKSIYSWKLVPQDKLPKGKRECLSLREMIEELEKEQYMYQNVDGNYTVLELVERYVSQKRGVRQSTKTGYQTVMNYLRTDPFSTRKIRTIKVSDAKLWLISLQEGGKRYSTIHNIRGVMRPAFQMAVEDDLLVKNPFDFPLTSVIIDDSVVREALTKKQEKDFLHFVKYDEHFSRYYEGIYILFKTGLRISEFCGLTISDLDMEERIINVNHQLQRTSNMEYVIERTKTNSGTRVIPMTDDVYDCFKAILENRKKPEVEPKVGKYKGFLYLDKNEMPMVALHWEKYFEHICDKYNKIFRIPIPKVTPHVCRHTYCSNMAKTGMNPKTLQYLMGHSEIGVTLNTYTHITFDDAKEELKRMQKICQ